MQGLEYPVISNIRGISNTRISLNQSNQWDEEINKLLKSTEKENFENLHYVDKEFLSIMCTSRIETDEEILSLQKKSAYINPDDIEQIIQNHYHILD